MLPLRNALKGHADTLQIWNDRPAFRDVDKSISRLKSELLGHHSKGKTVAVVTHSFGDWLTRQAIANLASPPILALASIAPVMAPGVISKMLKFATGSFISEVRVFANRDYALLNIEVNERIERLIVWSRSDAWVTRVPVTERANQEISVQCGTHMSLVFQRSVHHLIRQMLIRTSRADIQVQRVRPA